METALFTNLKNSFKTGEIKLNQKEKKLKLMEFLPEIIVEGIDYSLITQREANFFKIYCELRKEFSKKYPNPNPIDDEDTFVDSLAQQDSMRARS
jgi:hypothetical protein